MLVVLTPGRRSALVRCMRCIQTAQTSIWTPSFSSLLTSLAVGVSGGDAFEAVVGFVAQHPRPRLAVEDADEAVGRAVLLELLGQALHGHEAHGLSMHGPGGAEVEDHVGLGEMDGQVDADGRSWRAFMPRMPRGGRRRAAARRRGRAGRRRAWKRFCGLFHGVLLRNGGVSTLFDLPAMQNRKGRRFMPASPRVVSSGRAQS